MVWVFAPDLRSGQLHRPVTDAPNGQVAADRHGCVDVRYSGHYAATSWKSVLPLCVVMASIMPAGGRPVVPHPATLSRTACGVCRPLARRSAATGLTLLGGLGAEEGRAVDAAVETRPGLAVCELLLEPVEAAELAAEVVHGVDQGRLA